MESTLAGSEVGETAPSKGAGRSLFWDTAKGVLIILVVAGHVMGPNTISFELPAMLSDLYDLIFLFHMPAFILVSGYLWGRSARNPLERIPKFVGIYVLMSLLYAVAPVLTGHDLNLRLGSPRYGLWYLVFLVYGCVVAWFVKREDESGRHKMLVASFLVSLFVGMDDTVGGVWDAARAFYFMPFLIAGMTLDVERIIERARGHRVACVAMLVLAVVLLRVLGEAGLFRTSLLYGRSSYYALDQGWRVGIVARAIVYALSSVTTVAFFGLLPERGCRPLAAVGCESLIIYLIHTFMLATAYDNYCEILPFGPMINLATYVVLIVFVCCVVVWLRHRSASRRQLAVR